MKLAGAIVFPALLALLLPFTGAAAPRKGDKPPRCSAVTKNGERCKRAAVAQTRFCRQHARWKSR
ncbi:MAG: hypothetical protein SFV51_23880 [Bryobacteraceae bacterium]|nr:hypothetical protein [Bryobacteraceae bacterium]